MADRGKLWESPPCTGSVLRPAVYVINAAEEHVLHSAKQAAVDSSTVY